ncbi:MAG: CTP synthase [Kiritimatiellaceae bacterium]|nr:MAG: CTP synthase [Kiritimatiellaceae bacterium]
MVKYLFITGGVVSSLGKGITAASVGRLLINRGLSIRMLKMDPYLNVDPGTMSPYQHGEVYVTDDGAETDLDLGHYERYTGQPTSQQSNITAGSIYWDVLHKERKGDYLGATIQMIPHISNEIKERIRSIESKNPDIVIVELGGTVGDIEGLIFLESMRQLALEVGRENSIFLHLTYIPFIAAAGEVKTKPTQQSVAKLREIGIMPDVLICRTEVELDDEHLDKLSLFCNVDRSCVIVEKDVDHSIYEIPIILSKAGLDEIILKRFCIDKPACSLADWEELINVIRSPDGEITIGVVGKYSELQDAYKSVDEALMHGGYSFGKKVLVKKIAAEEIEKNPAILKSVEGILIPGGFGSRGMEGKILAAQYAREHNIPFLGICLGLQCAVIEFSRNVCGFEGAHTTEFDDEREEKTDDPVVCLMGEQEGITELGGTMRLGAYRCRLKKGTKVAEAYGSEDISERHRHRYEVNNKYRDALEKHGMILSGVNPDIGVVEMIELENHPWFVGTQAHPELKSEPVRPHPLFKHFVGAAIAFQKAL